MARYLWFSDTHLDVSVLPALKRRFVTRLRESGAEGLIITGDVSTGLRIEADLRWISEHWDGPVYFVLGNHDYHLRHIASVHADVRRLCGERPNLRWLTDAHRVDLGDDVALIGTEGWYDGAAGDPRLLRWTTDWFQTFDFLALPDHAARLVEWRRMAAASADLMEERLDAALSAGARTVYVATHFPPWPAATRAVGTPAERFWLPYNSNVAMGRAIERVMEGRRKRRVVVLAGHTHTPCHIRVSAGIECMVARASYWGRPAPEQTLVV